MNPRRVNMVTDGGEYGYSEMWPGFQMNYNVASYNMDQMSVSERESCGKEGTSTSNSNGGKNSNSTALNQGDNCVRVKAMETNENGEIKAEVEGDSVQKVGEASKPAESPKDYIHVRARRGQATDSHSLAERARREKISERMKILQNLVPGCNNVAGKALVLDEIINYIQSLQRQVEFLAMKLEAVNSRLGIEQCQLKEVVPPASQKTQLFTLQFPQQSFLAPSISFGSPNNGDYGHNSVPSPEWLHMQIGGGFDRMS